MAVEKDSGGGRRPTAQEIESNIVIDATSGYDPGAPAPGTYVPTEPTGSTNPTDPTPPASTTPPKTPPTVPTEPAATKPVSHGGTFTQTEMPSSIEIPSSGTGLEGITGERSLAYQPTAEEISAATRGIYEQTMAALQEAGLNPPSYVGRYDDQINEIYNQIVGRGDFRYDLNGDALYQMYADQYADKGRMAMRDSMGQAAGLTGGYSSTYGQAVGQQQYDRYLQELYDKVPELYDRAYQRYQDEGDRMLQEYQMLLDKDSTDYSRYMDEYNQWLTERSYADSLEEREYERQKDALNMLTGLLQMGYTATDEEIQAAGLTRSQYNTMKKYYDSLRAQQAAAASGGEDNGYETYPDLTGAQAGLRRSERLQAQQELYDAGYLKSKPDGVWGPRTEDAYKAWEADHPGQALW